MVPKVLEHLGLPAAPTELAPARLPDALGFDYQADFGQSCSAAADDSEQDQAELAGPGGRGPPLDDTGL